MHVTCSSYLIIGINLITVYRPQTSNVTSTSRTIGSSVPGKAMTLVFFVVAYPMQPVSLSHIDNTSVLCTETTIMLESEAIMSGSSSQ